MAHTITHSIGRPILRAVLVTHLLLTACGSDGGSSDEVGPTGAIDPCPVTGEPQAVGRIDDDRISECSGLAWSRTQPILWLHNDSGDVARFFGVGEEGSLLAVVRLSGAQATDWEDMAIGPWPGGGDALYLGDIGDNLQMRSSIRIYRVPEPSIGLQSTPADLVIGAYDTFDLTYPDGPHNAEALLVDPATGDVYVVTKEASGIATVFYAPAPAHGERVELAAVDSLGIGSRLLPGSGLVTGGDVSPDGSQVILRTYDRARVFRRRPGEALATAFATEPCSVPLSAEAQGESVAFAPDGEGYATVSEGLYPVIYVTEYAPP